MLNEKLMGVLEGIQSSICLETGTVLSGDYDTNGCRGCGGNCDGSPVSPEYPDPDN